MAYSDVGYTLWFGVTTLFVIAILVVGMILASGTKVRRAPKREHHWFRSGHRMHHPHAH